MNQELFLNLNLIHTSLKFNHVQKLKEYCDNYINKIISKMFKKIIRRYFEYNTSTFIINILYLNELL